MKTKTSQIFKHGRLLRSMTVKMGNALLTTLIVIFLLAFAEKGRGQTPLATEGFEGGTFPPTGWRSTNGGGTSPGPLSWVRISASTKCSSLSTYCAFIDTYSSDNAYGNYAALETPVFSLTGYASATLNFNMACWDGNAYNQVYISTDGGSTYNTQLADYGVFSSSCTSWGSIVSINLTPYIGQSNLRIEFYVVAGGTSTNKYGVFLDNVGVTGTLACTTPGTVSYSAGATNLCVGGSSTYTASAASGSPTLTMSYSILS